MRSLLNGKGTESARRLQRELRNLMTEHAGVVRTEQGLQAGLGKLDDLEGRAQFVTAHPDIAGFDDLAHAYDLLGSLLAARAPWSVLLNAAKPVEHTTGPTTQRWIPHCRETSSGHQVKVSASKRWPRLQTPSGP